MFNGSPGWDIRYKDTSRREEIFRLFIRISSSPGCSPASDAGEPSTTSYKMGRSWPTWATTTMANNKAAIRLKTGPAAITEIRVHTDLLLKAAGSGLSASSPTIIQDPPKGRSLMEYLVSPFVKPTSVGPIPRQNSLTLMPLNFARRKCPNS